VGLGVVGLGLVAAGVGAARPALGQKAGNKGAGGGTSVSLTEPAAPLLPDAFGEWKNSAAAGETPGYSLVNVNKDALEESAPQRSQVAEYTRGGRTVHVEAIQFADRTGATSAFSLVERPGMTVGKEVGDTDAVGVGPDGAGVVLFAVGPDVVLANFAGEADGGALKADAAALKPLVNAMPRVYGSKDVAPLLPSLLPASGRVPGTVRYALGQTTYALEGGVLQASSLGWDKELEAVTAQYDDARGKEMLTLLLYPTPTIAASFAKDLQGELGGIGASAAGKLGLGSGVAKVRREGPLVIVAGGGFAADAAQKMVENVHLQVMTFNQDVQPTFHIKAVQTFSLLTNIAILSGILCSAAVLLGIFLGFGRATYRVMRGKPAAVESEFLSLHLSPQSKKADFGMPGPMERS
jgi:hypothetical protein